MLPMLYAVRLVLKDSLTADVLPMPRLFSMGFISPCYLGESSFHPLKIPEDDMAAIQLVELLDNRSQLTD